MANEKVVFKRGTTTNLPTTKTPGTVLLDITTGAMYVDDTSSSRIQVKDTTKLGKTETASAAKKLSNTTAIGSATNPVYFNSSGVPVACTYTLGKSVPSNAVFTDTKVTAVGNHYTPSGGTTTSASGGTLTDITNSTSGVQVVTGVTKDAAGHVTGVTSVALKSVNTNTDTKVTQTNTTTAADYRVILSANANDTTETSTARKSTNFLANPSTGEFYAKGYRRTDISGKTVDIDTYNLSSGSPMRMFFIEKTNAGAANITNIPVTDVPFLLDVELIRWVSATDYVTRQIYTNATNPDNSYVRYCISGTWGDWTTRVYTDTTYSLSEAASGATYKITLKSPSGDVGTATVPAGTTSAYGLVKLSSATNSTSTALAATPSAVKSAYDLANSAKTLAGGKSTVSFSRSLTSGTKVGTITINGTATDIYCQTNTDTHYTSHLITGASATATANAAATNGNVYLNILDNTTVRDSHNIVGSGATTVTSDANGKITISSTNTVYTHPTTEGNKHIPSGGSSGQFLKYSAAGTAAWATLAKSDIPALDYVSSTTTRNANTVLAGPSSGNAAAPTFRALVTADLPASGATAGSYGPSANASPAHSGTFSVPYITVNAKGQVTAASTKTITLPASGNTDTKVTQNNSTADSSLRVLLSKSANDTNETDVSYKSNKITFNPSTGLLDIKGKVSISDSSYGCLELYRSGSNYFSGIKFYNDTTDSSGTKQLLGSIGMGNDPDTGLWRYNTDGSTKYKILDTENTSFTRTLTSGTKIGSIKINGTSTDIYCETNADTKNTAGSTNTSSKIFLIGATSQAANPQTYSHDTAYVGTDGCLYSNSTKVSVEGHTHTKSQITDFPASLKNPNSLTVKGNGTASFTYDGSAAKTLNIKPGTGISVSSDTSGNITVTNTSTNTDTKVTQSESTTANYRPILIGYTNSADSSALTTEVTNQAYVAEGIYVKPSTGEMFSNVFISKTDTRSTKLYSSGIKLVTDSSSNSAMGMQYYTADGETQIGAIGMYASANDSEISYAYIGKSYSDKWLNITADNTDFSGSIYVPQRIINKGKSCSTSAGSGAVGYYCIAQFKITGTYFDAPIEVEVSDRGDVSLTTFSIRFANENSTDPAVSSLRYRGNGLTAYICKSAASTWQLWVQASGTHAAITIHSIKCSHMNKMTISYPETYLSNDNFATAIAAGGSLATNTAATVGTGYKVGSAAQWVTSRNINGMSINGSADIVNYGTCSTTNTTVEKVVACTGYALKTGSEITVKFTVTNKAKNPTLNVNSTGAKPIYYRGAAISASYLAANRLYTFRYNGTQYELVGDVNTNTDVNVTQTNLAVTTSNNQGLKLPLLLASKTVNSNNSYTDSNAYAVNCASKTSGASMTGLAWLETSYYTTSGTSGRSYAKICCESFKCVGSGNFEGNATSASRLQTARKINGVDFTGQIDISLTKLLYSGSGSSTVTISEDATNFDVLVIVVHIMANATDKTFIHATSSPIVQHPYCTYPTQGTKTTATLGNIATNINGTTVGVSVSNILISGSGSTVSCASETRAATINAVYGFNFS